MHGHPIEKPGVRLVFDVDLNIDEEAPFEQTCAMTDSSLRDGECCT